MDKLEIGNKIRNTLNIKEKKDDEDVVEKTGIERLGNESLLDNLGPTFLLCSAIFIGLILLILLVYQLSKVQCCSQRIRNTLAKIKGYLFWKPFIRYSYLNCLKFNMVAMTTFAGFKVTKLDITVSIVLLVFFVLLGIIYYLIIKRKN